MDDSEDKIRAAWDKYNGGWRWSNGPLRVPVPIESTSINYATGEPTSSDVSVVTFHLEAGHMDGKPSWRVVGRLEGAEIVVDISPRESPSPPVMC